MKLARSSRKSRRGFVKLTGAADGQARFVNLAAVDSITATDDSPRWRGAKSIVLMISGTEFAVRETLAEIESRGHWSP